MPDMTDGEATYPAEEEADSTGVTPLSMDDGKALFDYMNDFRADPTSLPPKTEGWPVGDVAVAYEWSDELFDLCLEHSINQAALGQISHDGVAERFDTVTSCSWNGWGENVAYNMESGDAALQMAIK